MPRREGQGKDKIFDPYAAYNFHLEIDGVQSGGFVECSGLQMETSVFEYKEGGNNQTTLKFPEHTSYGNITLKRGITRSNDLINWHKNIVNGKFSKNNKVAIILRNEKKQSVRRWNLKKAFPIKWTGPDFKADSTDVAIEALEIAYEGIQIT